MAVTQTNGLIDRLGGLLERLEGVEVDLDRSQLVDEALEVWRRPGFETFASLPTLRFEPFEHQLKAAERGLRLLRARAILADEVGLGKTIEAGLIVSELRLRGLAKRTLVVVPAGLVEQWREELETKFAIPSEVLNGSTANVDGAASGGGANELVIASLATARRTNMAEKLSAEPWDMVIFDEAHRLKNPKSASAKLASSLRSRFLLLLTATPVENDVNDLFSLVNLVAPGLLGSAAEFRKRHRVSGSTANGELVRDIEALRPRLGEVMIRHRRSEVALMLPRRLAETVRVAPADDEAELYELISERVRKEGREASSSRTFALRSVARMAGSSPQAVRSTLEKVGWHDLATLASEITNTTKAATMEAILRRHLASDEKVVVFSAFRETIASLQRACTDSGIAAVSYDGSLTRREKEHVIANFREDTPVLLTTESAGEGRNLQFCHVLVNYDLPWNPMQIEQRLGRIHRIGQDHDVLLMNLVNKGSLEEQILRVLEQKINLFELVIGELDMILGRVNDDFDFESLVYTTHVDSADDLERDQRLDQLGDEIAGARRAYLGNREHLDGLLPEDDDK